MHALLRLTFVLLALIALHPPSLQARQDCNFDEICQGDLGETIENCCEDCAVSCCGDGTCEAPYEDVHSCYADCSHEWCDFLCTDNYECNYCYGGTSVCINGWCEDCYSVMCDEPTDCWWCWGAGAGCVGGWCQPTP